MKAAVLFGPPGSGKGTQANLLSGRFGVPHVSTGDMLRERLRLGGVLDQSVAATMHAGDLVSDEVVELMVEERLGRPDAAKGFVLDGYPRTLAQAGHLSGWLDQRGIREVVIHLVVDYNVIIARLTGRRQCPRCGTLYNVASHPPKVDELCDLEGERLVIREDDSAAVIRERLDAYERQTSPVLDYYRHAGRRVIEVDANSGPPGLIFQRICQAMETDDRP